MRRKAMKDVREILLPRGKKIIFRYVFWSLKSRFVQTQKLRTSENKKIDSWGASAFTE
jgi:hypothetical protein